MRVSVLRSFREAKIDLRIAVAVVFFVCLASYTVGKDVVLRENAADAAKADPVNEEMMRK